MPRREIPSSNQANGTSDVPRSRRKRQARSCGAFLSIPHKSAASIASQLKAGKIIVDARDGLIPIRPDILAKNEELGEAVAKLAYGMRGK